MNDWSGLIRQFPHGAKWLTGLFILILSFGFSSGIRFVHFTTSFTPTGIQENYLGNEANEEAPVMKFERTEQEMMTMLHTHLMSLSIVFFISGLLVLMTSAPEKLKRFLALEPLISMVFTFGGIFLMWKLGINWMKYIIIISGVLMTLCFSLGMLLILKELIAKEVNPT